MANVSASDNKYDPNQLEQDKQKQQQLHQFQRDLADAISRLASLDDIRILLASGAKVNVPVTQGLHPIHYAVYQNFLPAVRLLILRGCDVNAMDDNGYTPVHLCAERGNFEALELLISHGARVCFTDLKEKKNMDSIVEEPLSLALKRGHLDCAELLLKNGADPNAKYFMGSEINMVGILEVPSIRLLLKYGADPDSRDRTGLTPLMKAARHPQGYATVKLLIDHGADVNSIAGERHEYRTVLHQSIFGGNLDLIRLLLTSGARYPRIDLDTPSPLDIAIVSNRLDIAELLIEFDADLDAGANSTMGQPLRMALSQRSDRHRELIRLLLDHGADPNSRPTSNRNSGPPLVDYLNSVRETCFSRASSCHPAQVDLEIVRLLLIYGAKVVLKLPSTSRLVTTLERIKEELSLDLLLLLIDAAEEIDWSVLPRIIYECLRRADRARVSELVSQSGLKDPSAERLASHSSQFLAVNSIDDNPAISETLIKLVNGGKQGSPTLSLKQLARVKIRQYLRDELGLKGWKLIYGLNCLDLPEILRDYLFYRDYSSQFQMQPD